MARSAGPAILLAITALFLIANRSAFEGYFQEEEMGLLNRAAQQRSFQLAQSITVPRFPGRDLRPSGDLYFHILGRRFGLHFPPYVAVLQVLHVLNIWLIWALAQRLGADLFAASAGALLFAFHMATFDAYWRPMYIYDVLCASFCLASLLLFTYRRWILSFGAFWLACKSKDLAIMLPAVLGLYEYWFGKRQWKILVPFCFVSAALGAQAVLLNPDRPTDFGFRFRPRAVARTGFFYSGRILLLPFAGLAIPALPLLFRDKRVWLGIAAMFLFFVPLAFVPGRMLTASCYVPLIGGAIALSGIAVRERRAQVGLFLLFWVGWNALQLPLNQRQALAVATENRVYVESLSKIAASALETSTFICDGCPYAFGPRGVQSALQYFSGRRDVRVWSIEERPAAQALLGSVPLTLLNWNPLAQKLSVIERRAGTPDASYLRMDRSTPVWQLLAGWYPLEDNVRPIHSVATARLFRPAAASGFAVTVHIGSELIRRAHKVRLTILMNGSVLGRRDFSASGLQTEQWAIVPRPAGAAVIEFRLDPPVDSTGDRFPGVAIADFGFISESAS